MSFIFSTHILRSFTSSVVFTILRKYFLTLSNQRSTWFFTWILFIPLLDSVLLINLFIKCILMFRIKKIFKDSRKMLCSFYICLSVYTPSHSSVLTFSILINKSPLRVFFQQSYVIKSINKSRI